MNDPANFFLNNFLTIPFQLSIGLIIELQQPDPSFDKPAHKAGLISTNDP